MLSGIKFIPRDQLDASAREISDSDSSPRERRKSKISRRGKSEKRRKKSQYDSSDEDTSDVEGLERSKKSSESRKKQRRKRREKRRSYSSDDDDMSSSASSESDSEIDVEEQRRKKSSRKKTRDSSSENDSFSSEEDMGRCGRGAARAGRKKHGEEKRKDREVDGAEFSRQEKELARKEMGLEWMLKSGNTTERKSTQNDVAVEEPVPEEIDRANPRELNPYFKDKGSGYPDDATRTESRSSGLRPPPVVGDGGASWRLKALKRAQEQAAREGRKLDEVVEERWGSLGQLAASVASSRTAHSRAHVHAIKDRKRGLIENSENVVCDKMKGGAEVHSFRRDYLQDVTSRHSEMRKPKHDSFSWRKRKGQNISSEDNQVISTALASLNKYADDGSFMEDIICRQVKTAGDSNSSHVNMEANECSEADAVPSKTTGSSEGFSVGMQGVSANQLAAKALQLRLKGKHEEAEKLLKEIETMTEKQDYGVKMMKSENVGDTSRYIKKQVSSQSKKREEDADFNLAQKIIQNKQYSMAARADDEYDFDEAPTRERNKRREGAPEEKSNFPKRILTQQERCQFCFDNPTRPKHLVVSIANFTYMMLPQWQPVVEGHCCILPLQHESATRTIDDDVWEEIRNYKKCLIMMFAKQDKEVVFLETVIGLAKQCRHCLVECIPLPRELAKEAPLYFKKDMEIMCKNLYVNTEIIKSYINVDHCQ